MMQALQEQESSEREDQLIDLLREQKKEIALSDLFYFGKYVLGYDFEEQPHRNYCNDLQNEESLHNLNLEPRGSFKTTCTIAYVIWKIVKNPNIRFMIDCEDLALSKAILGEIKTHLEKNDEFRLLFGDYVGKNKWTEYQIVVNRRTKILKDPTVNTSSVEVNRTGAHVDELIEDDLHSRFNSQTPEQIAKVVEHWQLNQSILDPKGREVINGTRYAVKDLYGQIIEKEKERRRLGKKKYHIRIKDAETSGPGGTLYFPKRLTKEFLEDKRIEQGSYVYACTPAETPILMANWTFKPICEVSVGDEIIGYELACNGKNHKLVVTKVTETNSRMARVNSLIMESGRRIRCTEDHNWYTGRNDYSHYPYRPAQIGSKLLFVTDPCIKTITKQEIGDYRYLAGIIDGEGSVKHKAIYIHQSKTKNPEVHKEIQKTLKRLNIPFGRTERLEYIGKDGEVHQSATAFYLTGDKSHRENILRYGKPAKARHIVNQLISSRFVRERDEVVNIIPEDIERVYALTTETGNYIAWGYASKNCQYKNNPVDPSAVKFKPHWIKFYGRYAPDKLVVTATLDPAISTKDDACYSNINICGTDVDGYLYLLDNYRFRAETNVVIDEIFRMYNKWPMTVEFGIETFAFQKSLKYWIAERSRRNGVFIPVKELKTDTKVSKDLRIKALIPYVENGTIQFPGEGPHSLSGGMLDLYNEMITFPVGEYDDALDSLASQLQLYRPANLPKKKPEPPKRSFEYLMQQERNRRIRSKSKIGVPLLGRGEIPNAFPGILREVSR